MPSTQKNPLGFGERRKLDISQPLQPWRRLVVLPSNTTWILCLDSAAVTSSPLGYRWRTMSACESVWPNILTGALSEEEQTCPSQWVEIVCVCVCALLYERWWLKRAQMERRPTGDMALYCCFNPGYCLNTLKNAWSFFLWENHHNVTGSGMFKDIWLKWTFRFSHQILSNQWLHNSGKGMNEGCVK